MRSLPNANEPMPGTERGTSALKRGSRVWGKDQFPEAVFLINLGSGLLRRRRRNPEILAATYMALPNNVDACFTLKIQCLIVYVPQVEKKAGIMVFNSPHPDINSKDSRPQTLK